MRWFWLFFILFLSIDGAAARAQPNIVVFIADDLGIEGLGIYGNKAVHTPNIDALARDGRVYENFWLTTSSCSPSRNSLLTGLMPSQTGAADLHKNVAVEQRLLFDSLKDAGYWTALVGKSHGTNRPATLARIDHVQLANWKRPEIMGSMWMDALDKRPRDKPFLLWAASIDPHRPYRQGSHPHRHDPAKVEVPAWLADTAETRSELAEYYDKIGRFDAHIGDVVRRLRDEGLLDSTLILVLSDNGAPMANGKTRINGPGLRSPLLIRWPTRFPSGRDPRLVSAVDIVPTLMAVTGAKPPASSISGATSKGVSLLDKAVADRTIFAERNWHGIAAYERAAIDNRWLYVRNWIPANQASGPGDVVPTPHYQRQLALFRSGKLSRQQSGSFVAPREAEELYDLRGDPMALTNVSGKVGHRAILARMRKLLAEQMRSIGDGFPGADKLRGDAIDRETGLGPKGLDTEN